MTILLGGLQLLQPTSVGWSLLYAAVATLYYGYCCCVPAVVPAPVARAVTLRSVSDSNEPNKPFVRVNAKHWTQYGGDALLLLLLLLVGSTCVIRVIR